SCGSWADRLLFLDLGVGDDQFDLVPVLLFLDLAGDLGVLLARALVVLLALALVLDVVGDGLVAVFDDESIAAGVGLAELALGADQLAFEGLGLGLLVLGPGGGGHAGQRDDRE